MAQKEKLFNDKLKEIFIGEKIEGKSGFANLMQLKSNYFDKIFEELNDEIRDKTENFPKFREELYNKLYTFLKRYFTDSGSILYRRTTPDSKIYEKVYDNEKDVSLFWKTNMLYYVKTEKIWKPMTIEDYEKEGESYDVEFDVSELEGKKGNEKKPVIFELDSVKDDKIIFKVKRSSHGSKTKTDDIRKELNNNEVPFDREDLEHLFKTYKKQNDVDFFINKDAELFLKEQFDLWVKQYVMDDETIFGEDRLKKLKVLRDIAYEIINFVSQFEEELKKIWNKPKFVLNSNYVVSLDKIVEKEGGWGVFNELKDHNGWEDQLEEWRELGIIEEDNPEIETQPQLNGRKLNEKYQHLPIDTKYFEDLKFGILSLFENLDNELDGWLIHSENYQALNSIFPKFEGKIQTIYLDPPFNTGSDFEYKDKFQDSSWLTLMEDRLRLARELLSNKGSIYLHLDDGFNYRGRQLLDNIFGKKSFRNEIIWSYNRWTGQSNELQHMHDTIFWYSNSKENWVYNTLYKEYSQSSKEAHKNRGFIQRGSYKSKPKGEGVAEDDLWDINFPSRSKERIGFDTQKPEKLLKRIIKASSNKGKIVSDFFLGSGTTTAVAHKLGRKWIGVEMGDHFFDVLLPRMKKVLAYDKSGISKEDDVKENYNKNKAGGFFKYYDLGQYEQTLKNCVYEPSELFRASKEPAYDQYVFMKDKKMLDAVELDFEEEEDNIDFSNLYPNVDLAETLSNLKGKKIKKVTKNSVTFKDGEEIKYDEIDFEIIKPLIWW